MNHKELRKNYMRQFYLKNKGNFILTLVAIVALALFNLAISYLLQVIIDTAVSGTKDDIIRLCYLSLGLFAAFLLAFTLQVYVLPKYIYKSLKQYKEYTFEQIFKKDISSFRKDGSSLYISALTNDLQSIETNYINNIFTLIMLVIMFFGAFAMMLYYNRLLTIVSIILASLPLIVTILFGNKLAKCETDLSSKNASFVHLVKDTLTGFSVVKSFKAEKEIKKLLNQNNDELEKSRLLKKKTSLTIQLFANASSILAQLGVFLYGAYLSVSGQDITPGVILIFIQLMNFIVSPIGEIPQILAQRKSVIPLIDKIALATQTDNFDSKKEAVTSLSRGVTLKNLSFSYEDKEVLKNINYHFVAGKSYAIVGTSGSGKSTLFHLLMGNDMNYSGNIQYDYKEVKEISTDSLYSLISLVEQNVFVFDSSIINNITMYSEFPKEKIDQAIDESGLKNLIEEKGTDYSCGEAGKNLSGGEKQRISIARGLIKDAKILLMDEATSALDNETSTSVSNAILNIPNMTKIVITHRLEEPILNQYDQILVMSNGIIQESGTFTELMKQDQLFASMYKIANQA